MIGRRRGSMLAATAALLVAGSQAPRAQPTEPLVVARQGSFFAGGRTVSAAGVFSPAKLATSDAGQSFPVDHLFVRYQIPPNARSLPLIFVHGKGQFGKTWETTPDGREGFDTLFVRRGFPVYVVDFPRRAGAGIPSFRGSLGDLAGTRIIGDKTARFSDQEAFVLFRLGPAMHQYFDNSAFPKPGLDQFLKQNIASVDDDPAVISDALVALLDRIGPAVLVTHSQSGQFGWLAAMKSDKVRAVVTYEPGPPRGLTFPEGEAPEPRKLYDGTPLTHATTVPVAEFMKLTRIPIQVVNGDNFPTEPVANAYLDFWRVRNLDVQDFVAAINRHGGKAQLLDLPKAGIAGNSHFPFADLNNVQVADKLSQFLSERGLDRR